MKKQTTKRKITINLIVSTFSDLNQQFENVIFIESTIMSETNFKHVMKQHIEQSFDDVSSIDNLIEQSSKSNTRNQNFKFSFNQTIERQSNEKYRLIRFDQNFRDVKNDSSFKNTQLF